MEVTRDTEQPESAAHSTHIIPVVLVLRLLVLGFVTGIASAAVQTPSPVNPSTAGVPEISLQPRGASLRLAVTGDTGEGAGAVARGIAAVHRTDPLDAIVITGDNFYPCGVSSPKDPRWSLVTALTSIGIAVLPVLGNHDSCGKADPDAQIGAPVRNWRFPARQYAVRSPVADFAFVDTTPFVRGQSRSLVSVIPQVLKHSKAPWQIIVAHHPVISSGYHGYFPRDEVQRMRELIPMLRASGVDAVFAGHDHHLELIRGEFLHVISGAGSSPVPPIKLRVTTLYPPEIRREQIGFAVVEINDAMIRVRFHDERGRAKSEWIAIRKKPDPPASRKSSDRPRTTSSPSSPPRD